MSWRSGAGEKSVMAQQGWQEKCLGVAGLTRKVLWHSGAEKKSVLALR